MAHLEAAIERERVLAEVADKQALLDQQVLTEIAGVLAEPQLGRWPTVLQGITRERLIGRNYVYCEERVDVAAIVKSILSPADEQAIPDEVQQLLNVFSAEMSVALDRLTKQLVDYSRNFFRSSSWGRWPSRARCS